MQGACWLSYLPDNVLARIFDYLTQNPRVAGKSLQNRTERDANALRRTCRRLDEFYRMEYITHYVCDNDPVSGGRDHGSVIRALHRLPSVQDVTLKHFVEFESFAKALSSRAQHAFTKRQKPRAFVRRMHVEFADLSTKSINSVLTGIPGLEHLECSHCDFREPKNYEAGVLPGLYRVLQRSTPRGYGGFAASLIGRAIRLGPAELRLGCIKADPAEGLEAKNEHSLRKLRMFFMQVPDSAMKDILRRLPELECLDLRGCMRISPGVIPYLPRSVRSLDLVWTRVTMDVGCVVRVLRALPELERLSTSVQERTPNGAADVDVSGLEGHQLRELCLSRNGVDEGFIPVLRQLAQIQHLELNSAAGVNGALIEAAAGLPELQRLALDYTEVTCDDLRALTLGQCRRSLRRLSVRRCGSISPKSAEFADLVEALRVTKCDVVSE